MNGAMKAVCVALVVTLSALGCSFSSQGGLGSAPPETPNVYRRPVSSQQQAVRPNPPRMNRSGQVASVGNRPMNPPAQQGAAQPQAVTRGGMQSPNMVSPNAVDQQSLQRPPYAPQYTVTGQLGMRDRRAQLSTFANLKQMTFSRVGADFDVDIDPKGEWMVYASTQHADTSDLYLKKVGSSVITQFTNDSGNDVMPMFSPDGQWVAFASDRSGNWDIYVKNINGNKPIQVTNSGNHELHPSWAPDSRRLVFCALNEQTGEWEMIIVDVEQPSTRKYIGKGLFPEYSPDGKKVVFQRSRERGGRLFSIWTLDLTNDQAVRPTEIAASRNAAVINPTWSPDGRRLAFVTVIEPPAGDVQRPESADLWICSVDGTNRVNLTNDQFINLQPSWGPDDVIYFVSNRSGNDNIWSIRPELSLNASRPMVQFEPGSVAAPSPGPGTQ